MSGNPPPPAPPRRRQLDPLKHPSLLGRVCYLQTVLVSKIAAAEGAIRLTEIEALARSPGEAAVLDSLLSGLLNSGAAFESAPGWFVWNGGR